MKIVAGTSLSHFSYGRQSGAFLLHLQLFILPTLQWGFTHTRKKSLRTIYSGKSTTGQDKETPICHTNLTEAIKVFDLKEHDVHDVFNIFMCSGFTRDQHKYFVKVSDLAGGSIQPNCMMILSAHYFM